MAIAVKYLVLHLLADGTERTGSQVMNELGLSSGSAYVALMTLERQGLLASRWEQLDKAVQRNRQRLYRITESGTETLFSTEA